MPTPRTAPPKLALPSQEIRHVAALLERELLSWPGVTSKPMFGMRAVYRRDTIFAMLPDKRALESPTAIAYKLHGAKKREGQKWHRVELEIGRDVALAMDFAMACLEKAYRSAGKRGGDQ